MLNLSNILHTPIETLPYETQKLKNQILTWGEQQANKKASETFSHGLVVGGLGGLAMGTIIGVTGQRYIAGTWTA